MDLAAAFLNIEEFYRRVYWNAPTATTIGADGYTLSYSGVRWLHSANQLWFHLSAKTDETHLKLAERFFSRYQAEYSIVFSEPLMANLAELLQAHQYSERVSSPILMLEGEPHIDGQPPGADIVRAQQPHQQDLLQVMYEVFFVGPEVARCVVQPEHFAPESPMRHYLVYISGAPACCGSVSLSHGIAGLWSIGTLRAYRRRGLASALIDYVLREAASEGFPASVLLASPMGRPLYEAMGYRWIGDLLQYGPPGHEWI